MPDSLNQPGRRRRPTRCLDNYGWGTTNGTQLELWTCGGGNQQWNLG